MKAVRALPWWLWALLTAAAAIGGITAVGGFQDVPIDELPSVELDERHVGNEVTTVITDVTVSDTHPVLGFDPEEEVYLVVEATLENTTNEPSIFAPDLLRVVVAGAIDADDAPVGVLSPNTQAQVTALQPGLSTDVMVIWQVPDGRLQAGDDVAIGIFEQYWAPEDPRFDDARTAPVPVARIGTTIGERR